MVKNYSGMAPSLWTGSRSRDEYGELLNLISQSLWIVNFGLNISTRQKKEIFQLSQVIPAKSHSKKGIEETLFRVILRGLPKDDEIHRILGVIKSANDSFSGDKESN